MEGLTRLGCEVGFPNYLLVDKESSIMKTVKEAQVDLRNIQLVMQREYGVKFQAAPVSGHNFHGLVERRIKTVQECFEKAGFKNLRLHATGVQTLAKLVENDLNNLPLGFSYSRGDTNTPLLRLVTPNMMKLGRIHSRSLDGPVRLALGPLDMMKRVEQYLQHSYDSEANKAA